MKGIIKMKKNNAIVETNTEKKITKKKSLAFAKNATIMLMTAAIMIFFVPMVSAAETMDADSAFEKTVGFITYWFKRVGGLVAFVGIIMFGLAIKNNDAEQKQNALLTMVAGFVVVAACALTGTFGLTSNEDESTSNKTDKTTSTASSIVNQV